MTEPVPIKRRPGRPRKNPLPEEPTPEESKPVSVSQAEAPQRPADSTMDGFDPHIGRTVHKDATHVGFDDGSQYRVEDGVIMEKLN